MRRAVFTVAVFIEAKVQQLLAFHVINTYVLGSLPTLAFLKLSAGEEEGMDRGCEAAHRSHMLLFTLLAVRKYSITVTVIDVKEGLDV